MIPELPPIELGYARTQLRRELVADWRRAHERFWSDREIRDDLVVAERFRLVERL